MIGYEVNLACILTSGFFVFCTGQLEAWVDIFNGGSAVVGLGLNTTAVSITANITDPASGGAHHDLGQRWGSCQPVSMDASVWWSYGSEDHSQAQCPSAGLRVGTNRKHDQKQEMVFFMAPNYNCWELEDERVPEEQPVCEWKVKDFDVLEMGMGFHQMAVRLLVWLCLNHIQFFVSRMVLSIAGKTKKQEEAERKRELAQREIMTQTLYPSDSGDSEM